MIVLKLGVKYSSTVCDTQIMVIRTVPDPVDLRCGGSPMIGPNTPLPSGMELEPAYDGGTLIGKRYIDATDRIELLCTKGGQGALSLGSELLQIRQAKALPSSD